MGKMHIKTGDDVIVIAGKEKGKKGKVIATYPRTILKAALSKRKLLCMFPT